MGVVAQFRKKKGMGYHFKKGPGGTMQVVEVPMSELRKRRKRKGKSGGGRKGNSGGRKKKKAR